MNKYVKNTSVFKGGFSLVELLAVLIITSMIVITAIEVYGRVRRSAHQLTEIMEEHQLPNEILQRIAEDLDTIVSPLTGDAADTTITIENKIDNLLQSAQLIITRTYYNSDEEEELFEEITWRSVYDFETDSLILYRSHHGLVYEDKVLGREMEDKRELFVPVTAGLTYFKIEAFRNDAFIDRWQDEENLPKVVKVSLAFDEPYENIDGTYTEFDKEIPTRTIAIDRTRQIKFDYTPLDFNAFDPNLSDDDANSPADPNETDEFDPEIDDLDVNDVGDLR